MSHPEGTPVQGALDIPDAPDVYFKKGSVVWPERTGRGAFTGVVYARKLGVNIKGLSGYATASSATLYFDGRYWSLPAGARFGAYAKQAQRVSRAK